MNNLVSKIRLIGFACIAILAVIIFLSRGSTQDDYESVSSINWEETMEAINHRNSLNNANASGAPQQQVVNGWTAIDWLELISEQLNELPQQQNQVSSNTDNRVPTLLLLLVLGACLEWATKGISLEDKEANEKMTVENSDL